MPFLSFESLLGIGSIIFALAYAWERFRKGGQQADSDLIGTLTEQLKAQKEINESLSGQLTELKNQLLALTQEVGKLQGINEANDQKIKEYVAIIANRNPELEATLQQLEALIRDVVPFMDEMRDSHKQLRTLLQAKNKKRIVKETV